MAEKKVGAAASTIFSFAKGLTIPAALVAYELYERASGNDTGLQPVLFAVAAGAAATAQQYIVNIATNEITEQRNAVAAERNRLLNRDIANAVGLSIETLLQSIASAPDDMGLSDVDRSVVREMATRARSGWEKIGSLPHEDFEPLMDSNVVHALAADLTSPRFAPWGEWTMWLELLERLAKSAEVNPRQVLLHRCAEVLRTNFVARFFEDLKHDFANHGKAFAAIQMRMLGHACASLARLDKTSERTRHQFDRLNERLSDILERISNAQSSERAESLKPMTSWIVSIDGRLSEIFTAVSRVDKKASRLRGDVREVSERVHQAEGRAKQRHDEQIEATTRSASMLRRMLVLSIVVLGTGLLIGVATLVILDMQAAERDLKHKNEIVVAMQTAEEANRQRFAAQSTEMMWFSTRMSRQELRISALSDELMGIQLQARPPSATLDPPALSTPSYLNMYADDLGVDAITLTPESVAILENAIRQDKSIVAARSYIAMGKTDLARKMIESQASIDPFERALILADSYMFEKKFSDAADWYETALRSPAKNHDLVALTRLASALTNLVGSGDQSRVKSTISVLSLLTSLQTKNSIPWARTQALIAQVHLARHEGDVNENARAASDAVNAALVVYAKETYPQEHIRLQNNLAVALLRRADEGREQHVELAIAALDIASSLTDPALQEREWYVTQRNLGNAYRDRITGDKNQNVQSAIVAFGNAVKAIESLGKPEEQAALYAEIAGLWLARTDGDRASHAESAIESYELALNYFTRDEFPAQWGVIKVNIAAAWRIRSSATSDYSDLAISASTEAKEVFAKDQNSFRMAAAEINHAGAVLERQGDKNSDELELAISDFSSAISAIRGTTPPEDMALIQESLRSAQVQRDALDVPLENQQPQDVVPVGKLIRGTASNLIKASIELRNHYKCIGCRGTGKVTRNVKVGEYRDGPLIFPKYELRKVQCTVCNGSLYLKNISTRSSNLIRSISSLQLADPDASKAREQAVVTLREIAGFQWPILVNQLDEAANSIATPDGMPPNTNLLLTGRVASIQRKGQDSSVHIRWSRFEIVLHKPRILDAQENDTIIFGGTVVGGSPNTINVKDGFVIRVK